MQTTYKSFSVGRVVFNLFSNKNEYIFLFPYSWKPFDIPTEKTDWVDGLRTVAGGSIEIID